MVRKAFLFCGSLSLFLVPALADANFAQVQSVQGKVLVNQGQGFVSASSGLTLKPGDKVLISKEASAIVAYANGCEVSVSEPKLLTIAKTAPCPANAKVASVGTNFANPVAGGGGGFPPPVIGIGAFAGVAGTAFIVAATNKSTPISAP